MAHTDAADDKSRRERSPSFPFISLGKAIDRVRAVADAHKRSPARLITVADTWRYAPASSGLQQTASALKAYGLAEIIGKGLDRKIQLTDLAWRILHDERPGAREQAIKEAALRPRLFTEYAPQWLPGRPGDNHCISELHLDRGFTQASAELFLRVFDETVAFANLKDGDSLSVSPKGVEIHPPTLELQMRTHAPTIEAGDPYRISFGKGGMEVVGRLTTTEQVDDLIRSLDAIKLLFKRPSEIKKPDDAEEI